MDSGSAQEERAIKRALEEEATLAAHSLHLDHDDAHAAKDGRGGAVDRKARRWTCNRTNVLHNVDPRNRMRMSVPNDGRHRRRLHDRRGRAPVVLEHGEHGGVRAPQMHR